MRHSSAGGESRRGFPRRWPVVEGDARAVLTLRLRPKKGRASGRPPKVRR